MASCKSPRLPAGYAEISAALGARLRAGIASGEERLAIYWDLGWLMFRRSLDGGWPLRTMELLSADLRREFPERCDLSPRDLRTMEAFARAWPHRDYVPGQRGELSWRHQVILVENLAHPEHRRWYAAQALEHGLSPERLTLWIACGKHESEGERNPNFG